MEHELKSMITKVADILANQAGEECVSANIFFSAQGFNIEYQFRSKESLKRDGISMRNLSGEFIK